ADQRTVQLTDHVERRFRPRGAGFSVRGGAIDEAAPAIDRGIDLVAAAGEQQCVPAARAEADRADLAGRARQPAQTRRRGFQILYRLAVRQAEHDREHRIDVFRVRRPAAPPIERRRAGAVADIGKAPRQVADVVDEPEGLLDHDDAGVVSGLVRLCEIGGDLRAAAGKRDDPALDATGIGHDAGYVRHRPSPSLEWEAD